MGRQHRPLRRRNDHRVAVGNLKENGLSGRRKRDGVGRAAVAHPAIAARLAEQDGRNLIGWADGERG